MKIRNALNKMLNKNIVECPDCMGDGSNEKMKTCKRCNGMGEINLEYHR